MKISTTFDYNQVQFDKDNELVLMTSVKAPKINLDKERVPLNLSLALDISGSMSGSKLDMLKATVSKLIQQLNEKDTLSIVSFSDYVEEVVAPCTMTSINKDKASLEVSKLYVKGCTNMSGGLLKGFELVEKGDLAKDKIHRIFLFTDGQANVGLTTKDQFVSMIKENIGDKPISISCFGYGGGYSEDLLKAISENGKGNFYFVSNTDDINKTFARELGGLLSCFAQNVTINLEIKENTGTFIEVLNNLTVDSKNDRQVKITFDDIYSEEEKHLLIKVKLNKVTKAVTQRPSSIIKGKITYNDMTLSGKLKVTDVVAKIKFVKLDDVQKEATLSVSEQIAIIELAKAHLKAKDLADRGDFKGARDSYTYIYTYVTQLQDRGSFWGPILCTNVNTATNNLNASNYSTTVSNTLSSCSRGMSNYRSVDSSSNLYMNSTQKEMEYKFKAPLDNINVADLASDTSAVLTTPDAKITVWGDNVIINPSESVTVSDFSKIKFDSTTFTNLNLNQGAVKLNGISETSPKKENSLSKRRI